MLLHLMKSVYHHGPLWSSSLFVLNFEDWNGDDWQLFLWNTERGKPGMIILLKLLRSLL